MEIKVKYTAKNGAEFDDPFDCERYEKMLSEKPGTIGYILKHMKTYYKETDYFIGILFYLENGAFNAYSRTTIDLSGNYEGELVTQTMKDVQGILKSTVKEVIRFLEGKDKSLPCGGSIIVSEDIEFKTYNASEFNCDKVFHPELKR